MAFSTRSPQLHKITDSTGILPSLEEGIFLNNGEFESGAGSTIETDGDLHNNGDFDIRGATLIMDGGDLSNSSTSWNGGERSSQTSNVIFRSSPISNQELDFSAGEIFALEIEESAEVELGDDLDIRESLFIAVGGQLGEGDRDLIDDPDEEANQEDNEVIFRGFSLIVDRSAGETGYFFASQVTFNNDSSGDPDDDEGDPVVAQGEIFAETLITGGGTFVALERPLVVNELLTVDSNDELAITDTNGSLRLNDDFRILGTFDARGRTVRFSGATAPEVDSDGNIANCPSEGTTNNESCTQDLRGDGTSIFSTIEVIAAPSDGSDRETRVAVLGAEGELTLSNLVIDPDEERPETGFELAGASLTVTGDVENNGRFIPGDETVLFESGDSQSITSVTDLDFFNVEIDNSSSGGVSISENSLINVDNDLIVERGKLSLEANVDLSVGAQVLLKGSEETDPDDFFGGTAIDATTTDSFVELRRGAQVLYFNDKTQTDTPDGQIEGTLLSNRRLGQGAEWNALSNFAGTTYNSFLREASDDGAEKSRLWIQGPDNSEDSRRNFTNLIRYDEKIRAESGENNDDLHEDEDGNPVPWRSVEDVLDPPERGTGFMVYAYNEDRDNTGFPKVVELEGLPSPSTSFDNFTVTFSDDTAETDIDDQGWNLLGNPFPTYVDWDDIFEGSSTSNIDATVYVWDPEGGNYDTWNGDDGDLDDGVIAPFQGFFVKANDDNPNLEIPDITDVQVELTDGNDDDIFRAAEGPVETRRARIKLEMEEESATAFTTYNQDGDIDRDRYDALRLTPMQSDKPRLTFTRC